MRAIWSLVVMLLLSAPALAQDRIHLRGIEIEGYSTSRLAVFAEMRHLDTVEEVTERIAGECYTRRANGKCHVEEWLKGNRLPSACRWELKFQRLHNEANIIQMPSCRIAFYGVGQTLPRMRCVSSFNETCTDKRTFDVPEGMIICTISVRRSTGGQGGYFVRVLDDRLEAEVYTRTRGSNVDRAGSNANLRINYRAIPVGLFRARAYRENCNAHNYMIGNPSG